MTLLKMILGAIVQYRSFHSTYRELSSLTDHGLLDIGISRSDIPSLAFDLSTRAGDAFHSNADCAKRIHGAFSGFAS